jgi:hypothetical protein
MIGIPFAAPMLHPKFRGATKGATKGANAETLIISIFFIILYS